MAFILIPAFLTTGTDPSHSFRMTINISLLITPYRFPHYETLSFNRHSERCQECFVRKQESGNMTWSEESMTRMTAYRFSHYEYRFFTQFWRTPCHEFHFYQKTKKEQAPSAVPAPFLLKVAYFLTARAAICAFNSSNSDSISLILLFCASIRFAISTLE